MNLLYILLALVFFGVLIFIHELGHFLVARLCGVKILEFAIGMGPKIFSIRSKKSGTAYSLRLLPLGGFVSMLGENGMELAQGSSEAPKETEEKEDFFVNKTDEETTKTEEVPKLDPEEAKHAYCNQSVWKRMLISIAGPAMNVLLGFVLMVVLVVAAGEAAVGSTQVAGFFVDYSFEEEYMGLQKGDQIYEVDGQSLRSMAHFREMVAAKEGGSFTVAVSRPSSAEPVLLQNVLLTDALLTQRFVFSLSEGSGLQTYDIIKKVNNTPVHTANELTYEIMNQGYADMRLTVLRNGETVVLENVRVPSYSESGVVFGNPDFRIYREENFDFATVTKHAFWRSCSTVKMVFDSLTGLFSGRYVVETVSGPIGITQVITDAAKTGALNVLNLLIVISINLGIMNLLPLPALDGGHILLYIIEAIRRKPLKPEIEGIINFIGLALILGLAIIISIKDVISL